MIRSICLFFSFVIAANGQQRWEERNPKIHDPSTVVREDGEVWCFSTGRGVELLKRVGDGSWKRAARVFEKYPEWHKKEVPANRGHLWAPDVIQRNGRWWVYYSVSSFGSNESAIGLASGKSLNPESKDYGWKDEGLVIRSRKSDRFNAIDPAIIASGNKLWMSFGSFWDGIMLVELDPITGLMKDPDQKPISLAKHAEIEAPFICEEDGWYYLFVNWGKCCRGVNSTYEIRVGRSKSITGPYLDREGAKMNDGGGTLLLATDGRFIGPGHASIFDEKGKPMFVHHFYDKDRRGRSDLRMLPLVWKFGWPVVERE